METIQAIITFLMIAGAACTLDGLVLGAIFGDS